MPGGLTGAAQIGVEVGKVISRYKTAKHFSIVITDTSLAVTRDQAKIDEEAALDGFYVLRTPVPAAELDGPSVVAAYKNLKYVERDFRHIKSDDLDLRPIWHRLEERVKAHVLICMLACYLTWHLRRAWQVPAGAGACQCVELAMASRLGAAPSPAMRYAPVLGLASGVEG